MDITPLTPKDKLVINRYGDGGFVVSEMTYKGNILITANGVLPWGTHEAGALSAEAFEPLLTGDTLPEIFLIGSGIEILPIAPPLRAWLKERHISVDVMDTGAACRTYNVLISEDRRVAAALIAV